MKLDSQRKPRILIVEDEPMIALDLEDMLADADFEIAGVAATLETALHFIENRSFDAALLDANLNGTSAAPAAAALQARSLPYVVLSGYSTGQQPPALRQAVVLTKPVDPALVVQALRNILPVP